MQSSAEAEIYGVVDGAARGMLTKHMFEDIDKQWQVDIGCDSSAAIAISPKSGQGRTRHISTRWLSVQDAVRDKIVKSVRLQAR